MSDTYRDYFDKSFEQQWQDVFEGAEISPSSDLWDKIESQLPPEQGGKGGYFTFVMACLLVVGVFAVQRSNRLELATKPATISPKTAVVYAPKVEKNLPTKPANKTASLPQGVRAEVSYTAQNAYYYRPVARLQTANLAQNLPTREVGEEGSQNLPTTAIEQAKSDEMQKLALARLEKLSEQARSQVQKLVGKAVGKKEDATEGKFLTPLGLRNALPVMPMVKDVNFVAFPQSTPLNIDDRSIWVSVQRGFTFGSPTLNINYGAYLNDYAQANGLADNTNLTDFFTETDEKYNYSIANQGDIRIGYRLNPRWEFIAGLQYRVEFLEQTTNAFFVSYYDRRRHSFLIDILEGNIQNPNFARAVEYHPSYNANGDNVFRMSQFNQQGQLIHLSSRFEYLAIPIQIGYNLRPHEKFNITLLGAAQADKLLSSSTASYELSEGVENYYELKGVERLSSWSWQMGFGAQLSYQYSKHWGLMASSLLMQNVKSIKENKYVALSPRGTQVNMGLKYSF